MITITNKANCCGCSACYNVCPVKCIKMLPDDEGFLYPRVSIEECIDCDLCEKTCPFIKVNESRKPLYAFASKSVDDDVRKKSSSGGVFMVLAKHIIENGGVVIGAIFNSEWQVVHSIIDKEEDLSKLQGSKYVQSEIGDSFNVTKELLNKGRLVLYSGTACQIAGLKSFLKKDYDSLITVDVVCHGVPSPRVWNDYLNAQKEKGEIENIYFRDKRNGWVNYNFTINYKDGKVVSEPHSTNPYMMGFLNDLYLRPSCHECKVKSGRCGSDITLGDFWKVENLFPELNDNRGVSLMLVNTDKGKKFVKNHSLEMYETDYDKAVIYNSCIEITTPCSKWHHIFWSSYNQEKDLLHLITKILKAQHPSVLARVARRLKRFLRLG